MIVTSAVKEDRSQCNRKTAGSDCRFAVKGDQSRCNRKLQAQIDISAVKGIGNGVLSSYLHVIPVPRHMELTSFSLLHSYVLCTGSA